MTEASNELVARLSAAVGMLMEDSSAAALAPLTGHAEDVEAHFAELEQASRDATILIQAAGVLARRAIR